MSVRRSALGHNGVRITGSCDRHDWTCLRAVMAKGLEVTSVGGRQSDEVRLHESGCLAGVGSGEAAGANVPTESRRGLCCPSTRYDVVQNGFLAAVSQPPSMTMAEP